MISSHSSCRHAQVIPYDPSDRRNSDDGGAEKIPSFVVHVTLSSSYLVGIPTNAFTNPANFGNTADSAPFRVSLQER